MVRKPGVADHAVVGPDRAVLDVPGPVQDLERRGQPEPAAVHGRPQLGRLVDGGQVGTQDPAGPQGHLGMGQHPPRLGQVEQDPVEPRLVDPLVDVAHLHPVAGPRAQRGLHVGPSPSAKSSRSS